MRAPIYCAPAHSALATIHASARRLHSLRPSHFEAVRADLAAVMPNCTVDQHDDYEGDMTIVIVPDPRLSDNHCYILTASKFGIELAAATEDSVWTRGVFPTLALAVERLKQAVISPSHPSYVRVA